jgi:uncharacterized protein (DUF2267 family)
MEELVNLVAQRTGLTQDDARKAVEAVIDTLKSKLPPPIASHLDSLLAGGLSGGLGDLAQEGGEVLKGRLGTILGGNR